MAECYDCGASPAPIVGDDGNNYCEQCWNGDPPKKYGPDTEELLRRVNKATTTLNVPGLNIISLPKLPARLKYLDCSDTPLTSLPELPKGLVVLECSNTQLTSLPELPKGLVVLECSNTQLTSLPELPEGLEFLDCSNTQLTSLPELPEGLKVNYSNTPIVEGQRSLNDFKQQSNAFIKTLNPVELELVKSYTTPNGYVVLNTILRGAVIPPTESNKLLLHRINLLTKYNFLTRPKDCERIGTTKCFTNLFLNMWKRVPPLQQELQVYRGIQRTNDLLLHDNQFVSTTIDKSVANRFSGKECCFLNITLKPDIRALFIGDASTAKEEAEVLVGPPFHATIVKEEIIKGRNIKYIVIEPVKRKVSAGTRRRRNHTKRSRKQKL